MDTSLPIRVLPAFCLALLGLLASTPVVRAQVPVQPAPVRSVDLDPEFDRWVHVLVRQSESTNAEVAHSARTALDGLGARGRERADALRRDVRPNPAGERAGRPGPLDDGGPVDHRGPMERRGPPDGRAPDGMPRGPDRGPNEFGPRTGGRPDGPLPCGPGCCLHGRGARDGNDRPPFPPRDGRGPGHAGPRDFDPDLRNGPPPGRGPRSPLPPREEPSRPPHSVPKET